MKTKIKNIMIKIRGMKNTLKLLLSYILLWIIMNIFDVWYVNIFSMSDGGIRGLYFRDKDTLWMCFTLLFICWFFWGFKKNN